MISPDTRTTALEALEYLLQDYRDTIRSQPEQYAKWPDVRGDLHRRRMASRIRSVRAAIAELRTLPWRAAA